MTSNVKKLVNRKQRCWKKFCRNRSDLNFQNYKLAEKQCKRGVQEAKRRFERNMAEEGNKRPFAAYVKSKTRAKVNVGPLKVGNSVISDNKEMAVILNDFFVSVFTNEPAGQVPPAQTLPSASVIEGMVFTEKEVKKKLLALRPDSAPGPDRMAARFLRDHADKLAPALTAIFNKSMSEGVVPIDWKQANIMPIFNVDPLHGDGGLHQGPHCRAPGSKRVDQAIPAKILHN